MSSRSNPKHVLAKRPRPGRPRGATSLDPELARLFGDLIRELRVSVGASQEQIAFTSEMERSYFGRIERGESQPTLLAMLKIAWALGIEASQLMRLLEHRLGQAPQKRVK